MTSFTRTLALATTAAMLMSGSASADNGANAIETARKAIAAGHGSDCSLDMIPVDKGGYYPCIDIGPYRIVFTYGSVKAFVIQKDRLPYPIMDAPQDSPEFLRDGPWTSDMSARVALWWSDNVEGGAKRLQETKERSESQRAAEEYVNKLMGKSDAPPPQKPTQPPATHPDTLEIDEDIRKILTN